MSVMGTSRGAVSIAVCDRCKMKMKYTELRADGNSPGLRVCSCCWDEKDRWRLPRPPEKPISLRHPRPDLELTLPNGVIINQDDSYLVSQEGQYIEPGA